MSSHLQLLAAGSHAVDGDDVRLPLLADWEQKCCSACQQTDAGQHQDCRSIVSCLVLHSSQKPSALVLKLHDFNCTSWSTASCQNMQCEDDPKLSWHTDTNMCMDLYLQEGEDCIAGDTPSCGPPALALRPHRRQRYSLMLSLQRLRGPAQ